MIKPVISSLDPGMLGTIMESSRDYFPNWRDRSDGHSSCSNSCCTAPAATCPVTSRTGVNRLTPMVLLPLSSSRCSTRWLNGPMANSRLPCSSGTRPGRSSRTVDGRLGPGNRGDRRFSAYVDFSSRVSTLSSSVMICSRRPRSARRWSGLAGIVLARRSISRASSRRCSSTSNSAYR